MNNETTKTAEVKFPLSLPINPNALDTELIGLARYSDSCGERDAATITRAARNEIINLRNDRRELMVALTDCLVQLGLHDAADAEAVLAMARQKIEEAKA